VKFALINMTLELYIINININLKHIVKNYKKLLKEYLQLYLVLHPVLFLKDNFLNNNNK